MHMLRAVESQNNGARIYLSLAWNVTRRTINCAPFKTTTTVIGIPRESLNNGLFVFSPASFFGRSEKEYAKKFVCPNTAESNLVVSVIAPITSNTYQTYPIPFILQTFGPRSTSGMNCHPLSNLFCQFIEFFRFLVCGILRGGLFGCFSIVIIHSNKPGSFEIA